MLSILDKIFDKLPQLITTLETNRFGAVMLVVLLALIVSILVLYRMVK